MAEVALDPIPNAGIDLEHYVAALFQAAGYYVEKNLIERDPADVLELDIVASSYWPGVPLTHLVEVKGGGWGWGELFKLLGWMTYLGHASGVLFATTDNYKPLEKMSEKLGDLGITVVCFHDFADPVATFTGAGFPAPHDADLVPLWRHSYAIERKLTEHINQSARESSDAAKVGAPHALGPHAARGYQRLVNDGTFFASSPVHRLSMLYDAYKAHPRLTLACAVELDGGKFDPQCPSQQSQSLGLAIWNGQHVLLQGCMYNEHRARVAVLRGAIDYLIQQQGGGELPFWEKVFLDALPATFHQGLDWLRHQPGHERFAVFWQQFLWGWGGFVLNHKQEHEYGLLAAVSGLTVAEVEAALDAFDYFFPVPGGWLTTPGGSNTRIVKMVPTYFQGLGAHRRRGVYELAEGFAPIGGGEYTVNNLVRWNNAAVKFLTD